MTNWLRNYVKVQLYGRKYLHLIDRTRGKDSLEVAKVLAIPTRGALVQLGLIPRIRTEISPHLENL